MYKYIDDACINMNVYREKRVEEYLCRERERERVDKLFPSNCLIPSVDNQSLLCSVRSFWLFFGIDLV